MFRFLRMKIQLGLPNSEHRKVQIVYAKLIILLK